MILRPRQAALAPCFGAFLLLSILAPNVDLRARTINAASASFADVSAAVASAVNGDTVIVPAGTATWTSTLSITKAIHLIGQTTTDSVAGTAVDATIIQDNVSPRGPIIRITSTQAANDPVWRISGFTFKDGGATNLSYSGCVALIGQSHFVRVDHCHFLNIQHQSNDIVTGGGIWGVADHNVQEHNGPVANYSYTFYHQGWPNPDGSIGVDGQGAWAAPTNFGGPNFFFVEDNYIINRTTNELVGANDDKLGARWVWRHNHMYDIENQGHGTEGGTIRGGRAREIYNNDYHYTYFHHVGGWRTGPGLAHDNTFDGVKPPRGFVMNTFRAFNWYKSGNYKGASGAFYYDVNDISNGTVTPGQTLTTSVDVSPQTFTNGNFTYTGVVNGLYYAGTVTSTPGSPPGQNSFVDSSANWTPNMWTNFVAQRNSDNAMSLILSNTSNTLNVYFYSSAGSGTTWVTGDDYEIHRALIALDQPGRGQGDFLAESYTTLSASVTLPAATINVHSTTGFPASGMQSLSIGNYLLSYTGITGNSFTGCSGGLGMLSAGTGVTTVINSATGTPTWPHQVLEPCYSWNNTYTPDGSSLPMYAPAGTAVYVKEGRDFFNDTRMPGYTPYTYPHPLVSGGGGHGHKH